MLIILHWFVSHPHFQVLTEKIKLQAIHAEIQMM